MRELHFSLRHETYGLISDRSARQMLKYLAKAVRAAQVSVLLDFITSLDLEHAERRSLQDLVQSRAEREPAYNLQKLEKGSLFLTAVASASIVAVLVKILSDRHFDSPGEKVEVFQNLDRFVRGPWAKRVAEEVKTDLDRRGLGSHVVVDKSQIIAEGEQVTLQMKLKSDVEETKAVRGGQDTPESVQAVIDEALAVPRSPQPRR